VSASRHKAECISLVTSYEGVAYMWIRRHKAGDTQLNTYAYASIRKGIGRHKAGHTLSMHSPTAYALPCIPCRMPAYALPPKRGMRQEIHSIHGNKQRLPRLYCFTAAALLPQAAVLAALLLFCLKLAALLPQKETRSCAYAHTSSPTGSCPDTLGLMPTC
jgi:hypothetical protein